MDRSSIRTVSDVAAAALELFEARMRAAAEARGRFVVALAGGSTPLPMYERLAARDDLPWRNTWVLWGDERHVSPAHPRRNERAAREAFLDAVAVPPDQVLAWPWRADLPADAAAEEFAALLQERLGLEPVLDLALLGLGDDGHTASLFPGTGAVEASGLAVAVQTDAQPEPRLSLTAEALSRSRTVAFLVAGEGKRAALEGTLAGEGDLDRWPARAVGARDELRVLTDLELD